MTTVPPGNVHKGLWIDWSAGQVLGATITSSNPTANVIVAFIAILVATTGSRLWNILVFTFYQLRATDGPRDALFYQQQALLRNVSSPTSIIIDFLKLSWFWRKKTRGPLRRSLFAIIPAILITACFVVAGIFSSYMVKTSDLGVLVGSSTCGYWNWYDPNGYLASEKYYLGTLTDTVRYARECYGNNVSTSQCGVYVQREIPFTVSSDQCPFSSSICTESDNPALVMDTGLFDTTLMFGINAKAEDRVQIRKKTSCAPITLDGHTRVVSARAGDREHFTGHAILPGEQETEFFFGSPTGLNSNTTLAWSTYASNKTATFLMTWRNSYVGGSSLSSFDPIPALNRTDADAILVFVFGNYVTYLTPVNDILFSAHKESWYLQSDGTNRTVYISDNPAGIVACAEQYQFCNPNAANSSACTNLDGIILAAAQSEKIGLNAQQNATLRLFTQNVQYWPLDMSIPGTPNPPPLKLAEYQGDFGAIYGVPDDQWKIEVRGWMSIVLSSIQKVISDHAFGPGFDKSSWNAYKTPIADSAERQLCTSQIMLAPGGFSNINVFALVFTVVLCGLILVIDLFFINLIKFLAQRKKISPSGMHQWTQDGILQVQRRVYQSVDEGEWTGLDKDVPTTVVNKHDEDGATSHDEEASGGISSPASGNDEKDTNSTDELQNKATTQPLAVTTTRNQSTSDESTSSSPAQLARAGTGHNTISPISTRTPTSPEQRALARTFSHHSKYRQGSLHQPTRTMSKSS